MALPEFILVDGKKMPITNLTITTNGTELIAQDGEVVRWNMPRYEFEFVCDVLPDPDDPYGTKWHSLLFWLCGAMSYPWLFRN